MRSLEAITSGGAGRCRMRPAMASLTTSGTPNASAMQSAVMSSWVGPMPPVVST